MLWMILRQGSCKTFKIIDLKLLAQSMDNKLVGNLVYLITTSYYQRVVQMPACWKRSIIVNNQLRWVMWSTKVTLMEVDKLTTFILIPIIKQIIAIAIIVQRGPYKEWKCTYELRINQTDNKYRKYIVLIIYKY